MESAFAVPVAVTESNTWTPSIETLAPGSVAQAHYHEADEWLRLTQGSMTFIDVVKGDRFALQQGGCLHIRSGEVHSVNIGNEGASYQMWTSAPPSRFRKPLANLAQRVQGIDERSLAALVYLNFQLPRWENEMPSAAVQSELEKVIHQELVFRRGDGTLSNRKNYLDSFRPGSNMQRESSTDFEILHASAASVLTSVDVHTVQTVAPVPKRGRVRNLRVFVAEGGWRCRVWVNYPIAEIS